MLEVSNSFGLNVLDEIPPFSYNHKEDILEAVAQFDIQKEPFNFYDVLFFPSSDIGEICGTPKVTIETVGPTLSQRYKGHKGMFFVCSLVCVLSPSVVLI